MDAHDHWRSVLDSSYNRWGQEENFLFDELRIYTKTRGGGGKTMILMLFILDLSPLLSFMRSEQGKFR